MRRLATLVALLLGLAGLLATPAVAAGPSPFPIERTGMGPHDRISECGGGFYLYGDAVLSSLSTCTNPVSGTTLHMSLRYPTQVTNVWVWKMNAGGEFAVGPQVVTVAADVAFVFDCETDQYVCYVGSLTPLATNQNALRDPGGTYIGRFISTPMGCNYGDCEFPYPGTTPNVAPPAPTVVATSSADTARLNAFVIPGVSVIGFLLSALLTLQLRR